MSQTVSLITWVLWRCHPLTHTPPDVPNCVSDHLSHVKVSPTYPYTSSCPKLCLWSPESCEGVTHLPLHLFMSQTVSLITWVLWRCHPLTHTPPDVSNCVSDHLSPVKVSPTYPYTSSCLKLCLWSPESCEGVTHLPIHLFMSQTVSLITWVLWRCHPLTPTPLHVSNCVSDHLSPVKVSPTYPYTSWCLKLCLWSPESCEGVTHLPLHLLMSQTVSLITWVLWRCHPLTHTPPDVSNCVSDHLSPVKVSPTYPYTSSCFKLCLWSPESCEGVTHLPIHLLMSQTVSLITWVMWRCHPLTHAPLHVSNCVSDHLSPVKVSPTYPYTSSCLKLCLWSPESCEGVTHLPLHLLMSQTVSLITWVLWRCHPLTHTPPDVPNCVSDHLSPVKVSPTYPYTSSCLKLCLWSPESCEGVTHLPIHLLMSQTVSLITWVLWRCHPLTHTPLHVSNCVSDHLSPVKVSPTYPYTSSCLKLCLWSPESCEGVTHLPIHLFMSQTVSLVTWVLWRCHPLTHTPPDVSNCVSDHLSPVKVSPTYPYTSWCLKLCLWSPGSCEGATHLPIHLLMSQTVSLITWVLWRCHPLTHTPPDVSNCVSDHLSPVKVSPTYPYTSSCLKLCLWSPESCEGVTHLPIHLFMSQTVSLITWVLWRCHPLTPTPLHVSNCVSDHLSPVKVPPTYPYTSWCPKLCLWSPESREGVTHLPLHLFMSQTVSLNTWVLWRCHPLTHTPPDVSNCVSDHLSPVKVSPTYPYTSSCPKLCLWSPESCEGVTHLPLHLFMSQTVSLITWVLWRCHPLTHTPLHVSNCVSDHLSPVKVSPTYPYTSSCLKLCLWSPESCEGATHLPLHLFMSQTVSLNTWVLWRCHPLTHTPPDVPNCVSDHLSPVKVSPTYPYTSWCPKLCLWSPESCEGATHLPIHLLMSQTVSLITWVLWRCHPLTHTPPDVPNCVSDHLSPVKVPPTYPYTSSCLKLCLWTPESCEGVTHLPIHLLMSQTVSLITWVLWRCQPLTPTPLHVSNCVSHHLSPVKVPPTYPYTSSCLKLCLWSPESCEGVTHLPLHLFMLQTVSLITWVPWRCHPLTPTPLHVSNCVSDHLGPVKVSPTYPYTSWCLKLCLWSPESREGVTHLPLHLFMSQTVSLITWVLWKGHPLTPTPLHVSNCVSDHLSPVKGSPTYPYTSSCPKLCLWSPESCERVTHLPLHLLMSQTVSLITWVMWRCHPLTPTPLHVSNCVSDHLSPVKVSPTYPYTSWCLKLCLWSPESREGVTHLPLHLFMSQTVSLITWVLWKGHPLTPTPLHVSNCVSDHLSPVKVSPTYPYTSSCLKLCLWSPESCEGVTHLPLHLFMSQTVSLITWVLWRCHPLTPTPLHVSNCVSDHLSPVKVSPTYPYTSSCLKLCLWSPESCEGVTHLPIHLLMSQTVSLITWVLWRCHPLTPTPLHVSNCVSEHLSPVKVSPTYPYTSWCPKLCLWSPESCEGVTHLPIHLLMSQTVSLITWVLWRCHPLTHTPPDVPNCVSDHLSPVKVPPTYPYTSWCPKLCLWSPESCEGATHLPLHLFMSQTVSLNTWVLWRCHPLTHTPPDVSNCVSDHLSPVKVSPTYPYTSSCLKLCLSSPESCEGATHLPIHLFMSQTVSLITWVLWRCHPLTPTPLHVTNCVSDHLSPVKVSPTYPYTSSCLKLCLWSPGSCEGVTHLPIHLLMSQTVSLITWVPWRCHPLTPTPLHVSNCVSDHLSPVKGSPTYPYTSSCLKLCLWSPESCERVTHLPLHLFMSQTVSLITWVLWKGHPLTPTPPHVSNCVSDHLSHVKVSPTYPYTSSCLKLCLWSPESCEGVTHLPIHLLMSQTVSLITWVPWRCHPLTPTPLHVSNCVSDHLSPVKGSPTYPYTSSCLKLCLWSPESCEGVTHLPIHLFMSQTVSLITWVMWRCHPLTPTPPDVSNCVSDHLSPVKVSPTYPYTSSCLKLCLWSPGSCEGVTHLPIHLFMSQTVSLITWVPWKSHPLTPTPPDVSNCVSDHLSPVKVSPTYPYTSSCLRRLGSLQDRHSRSQGRDSHIALEWGIRPYSHYIHPRLEKNSRIYLKLSIEVLFLYIGSFSNVLYYMYISQYIIVYLLKNDLFNLGGTSLGRVLPASRGSKWPGLNRTFTDRHNSEYNQF